MIIKFTLNGEEKEIRNDSVSFMPIRKFKGTDKSGKPKESEEVLGYFSSLGSAVKKIIDDDLSSKYETITLLQYVTRYELAVKEVRGLLEDVEF